jgi:hemolysin activation/secretion protein
VFSIAWAADLPPEASDAATQQLLLQQERERALRQQQEQTPDVRLQQPQVDSRRLAGNESPCFTITRIDLDGAAATEFRWALPAANLLDDGSDDPALGRCLGTRDLNEVMKRVQNAIIRRGFITTRVLAAPQDLTQGVLRLTAIPGRIRTVRFADDVEPRAAKWNAVPASSGDLLNLRAIEQALENFKRVPTAEADIQIVPATDPEAQPGESDVVIRWKQGFPIRLSVSADDAGTDATGKYQGGVVLSYDNWWRLNDLFYVSYYHDLGGGDPGNRGSEGYTVHYSLPFGYWLLGLTTNQYDYHQSVAGTAQTYLYSGESSNSDVRLSRVIYRDAVRKSFASIRGWARSSKNFIDDTEVEVQRRRMAGWEVGLGHREFIGRAALDLNLAYRRGTGAWNSLPAPEEAFGEGTSRPRLFLADAQLNAPFTLGKQRLRYLGTWRGQMNRTPLVPQDRFAIGGRYTVRGFEGENTLLSERGWLIRNDVGLLLRQSKQELYVGADYGEVSGASAASLLGTRLAGGVLGLRGGSEKHLSYDVFVGGPVHKPEGFQTASTTAGFHLNWVF